MVELNSLTHFKVTVIGLYIDELLQEAMKPIYPWTFVFLVSK